jgi:hypothetical protein
MPFPHPKSDDVGATDLTGWRFESTGRDAGVDEAVGANNEHGPSNSRSPPAGGVVRMPRNIKDQPGGTQRDGVTMNNEDFRSLAGQHALDALKALAALGRRSSRRGQGSRARAKDGRTEARSGQQ